MRPCRQKIILASRWAVLLELPVPSFLTKGLIGLSVALALMGAAAATAGEAAPFQATTPPAQPQLSAWSSVTSAQGSSAQNQNPNVPAATASLSADHPGMALVATAGVMALPPAASLAGSALGRWWLKTIDYLPGGWRKFILPALSTAALSIYVTKELVRRGIILPSSSYPSDPSHEMLDYELLPDLMSEHSTGSGPDPDDPKLIPVPHPDLKPYLSLDEIRDHIFQRSLDRDDELSSDEDYAVEAVEYLLARHDFYDYFVSNPEAHQLMQWLSQASSNQLQQQLKNLKDAQQNPLFTDTELVGWSQQTLRNFLVHGVVNALELHVYLGLILGGGDFAAPEIAHYYDVDPPKVLATQAEIVGRLKQYHHHLKVVPHKLPHDASMDQIKAALDSLSYLQIKDRLHTALVRHDMGHIPLQQHSLLQGSHLFYFYKDVLINFSKKNNPNKSMNKAEIKNQKILGLLFLNHVINIREPDPDDRFQHMMQQYELGVGIPELSISFLNAMKQRYRQTLHDLLSYLQSHHILLPHELSKYSTQNFVLSRQAEETKAAIITGYHQLSPADLIAVGERELGLPRDAAPLTRSQIDNFMAVLADYPIIQVLFLTNVLGLQSLRTGELVRIFNFSLSDVEKYEKVMKVSFLNFLNVTSPADNLRVLRHAAGTQSSGFENIISRSVLEKRFDKLTPAQVVNTLITPANSPFHRVIGVDEFISHHNYQDLIAKIKADEIDTWIFMALFLHLNKVSHLGLAEMLDLSAEQFSQRRLQLIDKIETFLAAQLTAPRLAVAANYAENMGHSGHNAALTLPRIRAQLGYDRNLDIATNATTVMARLREPASDHWDTVSQILAHQTWFRQSTPQHSDHPLRLSYEQFMLLDEQVLLTPMFEHIFVYYLLNLDAKIAIHELATYHDTDNKQIRSYGYLIMSHILHLLLNESIIGTPPTAAWNQSAYWAWYQSMADRLAFYHLSPQDLAAQIRITLDEPTALMDVNLQVWQEAFMNRLNARDFSHNEWLVYLYKMFKLEPGSLTARVAPQDVDLDMLVHKHMSMISPKLTMMPKSKSGTRATHMLAGLRDDVHASYSYATSQTDQATSEAAAGGFDENVVGEIREWFDNLTLTDLTQHLKQFYTQISPRPWPAKAPVISELLSYINTLDNEVSWLVLGADILGYEGLDAALVAEHYPAYTVVRNDMLRSLKSIIHRHNASVDTLLFTRPTSLMNYSMQFLESNLRLALNNPQYRVNRVKLALFEEHYLDDNPILWQIYMALAGYRSQFKHSLHPDQLHHLVLKHLLQNTKSALNLTAHTSARRHYLIDHMDAFNHLRYPTSFKGLISSDDLGIYFSTLTPASIMNYITSLDEDGEAITWNHTFNARSRIVYSNPSRYDEWMEFLSSDEIRADPLMNDILLRVLLKLDSYSSPEAVAALHGVSVEHVKEQISYLNFLINKFLREDGNELFEADHNDLAQQE